MRMQLRVTAMLVVSVLLVGCKDRVIWDDQGHVDDATEDREVWNSNGKIDTGDRKIWVSEDGKEIIK